MKKTIIGLGLFTAVVLLSGCAEKNDPRLMLSQVTQSTISFKTEIKPEELTACPDKKIVTNGNMMDKMNFLVDGSTPEKYEVRDIGTSYETKACIRKDEKGKQTIDVFQEVKNNSIH